MCRVVGPGPVAFAIVSGAYVSLLLGTLGLTWGLLRRLLPNLTTLPIAIGVAAFAPVTLYLAFKTLQETPALFFTTLACYALVRATDRRGWMWTLVIGASLVGVGLTKQTTAIGFVSFVPVFAAWRGMGVRDGAGVPASPGGARDAVRVLGFALAGGILSLILWTIALAAIGVDPRMFLAFAANVAAEREPVASMLLQTALVAGVLYLAVPLAFLSPRRREATLLLIWLAFCTLPLILLTQSIEVRYLAQNLPPLCGLIALSLEGLRRVLADRAGLAAVGVVVMAGVIAATGSAAQLVFPHEVDADDYARLLATLDEEHRDGYAILTPWDYTDFHYLRFMYPGRRVYNVHTRRTQKGTPDTAWTASVQRRWYGERLVATPEALEQTPGPWVYVGFEQAFPVANLRWIASFIPLEAARAAVDRELARMSPRSQVRESWLWDHPRYLLVPIADSGHYRAYAVEPKSVAR